jgi:hypothetical protein
LDLDSFLLRQRQLESCGNVAGGGHGVQYHSANSSFFFLVAAGVFLQLQRPVPRPAGGLDGDVGAMGAAFRPIGCQSRGA